MALHSILLEKLNDALVEENALPFTPRDTRLSAIKGKVHSVIGMRRAGKTTFLRHVQAQLRKTLPKERALYLSFDDDRLMDLTAVQLNLLLEEYYRRFPDLRGKETIWWFLDEIQLVTDWERFLRRILDTEKVELVISGSSATLLSRELHTSLRGRSVETVIQPFSFREFLRHRGEEPRKEPKSFTARERSRMEKNFFEYAEQGGFPEAQGLDPGARVELLQSYVNTVLFRDVVERFGITQVAALRWLVRQCLRNPAGAFSVHRFYQDLKSQGHSTSKDTLHALFEHLTDAFLISAVPLSTESERRRNSNPRKIYPIDPALIGAFDATGRMHAGHAFETIVYGELSRRKAEVGYLKTPQGYEVDFHVRYPGGKEELIQVCADISDVVTLEREFRSFDDVPKEYRHARKRLLVPDYMQTTLVQHSKILVQTMYEWLLDEESGKT